MKLTIAVVIIVIFVWLYCLLGANKQRKNKTAYQSRTHYYRIMQMGVDELAAEICDVRDNICFEMCIKNTGNKFSCPYGEGVTPEQCQECVKKWLLNEVEVK